ncbi:class I adenylate-forming enzyme family protein [Frigidibacter sp. MR17.14]|uniref:class I adenylate-forming enzyme family protein n=1 Tax=Frigidibacter sp. MR17.14 TaxID=3126509 RepID=UPI003012D21B
MSAPSVFAEGSPPEIPASFNLAAHVLAAGEAVPDRIALQILRASGAERWSYARLIAAVRGTATGLLGEGLLPGDRVLLRLENSVEFPLAFLGAIAAGLVPVPTPAGLTEPEITKIALGLKPAAVIAGEGVSLPRDCPARVIPAGRLKGWEALPPAPWHLGPAERPGYIIYTSGTSGQARGVVHAHRAILARAMMHQGWYGLTATDRLLHAGAFNWTYTLGTGLMDPWTLGATALIPAPGTRPEQLALFLKRFDATLFAAAPGVFRQLLRATPALSLPKLRHGLSAGEKLPETTRAAWEAATGTAIHEALGMSEISTFVSAAPHRPADGAATGWPQPGRHVAVLGPDHRPVPRGEPGNLAVHRADPGLFLGYLDAPEDTAARFADDWYLTGDTVSMAEDGAITYLGRDDDMMNAGGFRVSPLEVEAALARHPALAEVACAEVPVKEGASVIAAFYVARAAVTEDELCAHAQASLARYKQPRLWIAVDALPKNANGKANRRALRQSWRAP